MEARKLLIHLALKHKGDFNKIYSAIQVDNDGDKDEKSLLTTDENCITILDADYPQRVKQVCFKQPIVLFYKGDISLLGKEHILSVLGVRNPTTEATNAAVYLLKDYKGTVVMGGSAGLEDIVYTMVDKPIVVLPNGLDMSKNLVDKVVALGGLAISEYPNGVEMSQDTCVERCRIIEALADKTLAIEIKKNSSSLIRVTLACNNGNDVYVVPKAIGSDDDYMNNKLIYEGAKAMLFKEDLQSE